MKDRSLIHLQDKASVSKQKKKKKYEKYIKVLNLSQ